MADDLQNAVRRPRPDSPSYDPAARGRRAVPRADPDRHLELRRRGRPGGAEGRGVRRRAARRGRHRGPPLRVRAGAHVAGRALGRDAARGTPLLLHGHLDVVPGRRRGLAGRPVLRRDPGRLRLGPRCGRHEGLRRDAAVGGAGAGPRRARCPNRPVVLCFTADEEAGGHKGAEHIVEQHRDEIADCTEAVGEVGGFSTTVRGQPDLPHRGRREGHGLDEADRPRHAPATAR